MAALFVIFFASGSGWQTFSITDTGWFFIGSHGYHITILTKINCNYFSVFCMKNLNNHISCSGIFIQIITRPGIAVRNPATAEGITGTGVFISTVQINQYGSGYSPAGSVRFYRILWILLQSIQSTVRNSPQLTHYLTINGRCELTGFLKTLRI